jgi:uncharacterized protein (TIGR03083 family)
MSFISPVPPLVTHLLPVLNEKLIILLRSLTQEEWQLPTVARLWTVKDVAAHLLDGNIRTLSLLRDGWWGEKPEISSYQDLVDFLNQLNRDWVTAMRRVSPAMLIYLHEATGKLFSDYYQQLDPSAVSPLAVAWAGEDSSTNRMHLAREYTEKWLHQQQIRDAVGKPGILTHELFYPFIDTVMFALPHTYRSVAAPDGTAIKLQVTTEAGGSWFVVRREGQWQMAREAADNLTTEVILDPDTAWKLFSKSLRPEQVMEKVTINGDYSLGQTALQMVSVMA